MENKKFILTDETKVNAVGVTLYRIKAVKSFASIQEGELGGWLEKESNLSHEGNCWVYSEAQVFGSARVYDDAEVFDNAKIHGNAEVYDNAKVYGNAEVYDDAVVYGIAEVYGKTKVYGDTQICGEAKNEDATTKSTPKPQHLDNEKDNDLTEEVLQFVHKCETDAEYVKKHLYKGLEYRTFEEDDYKFPIKENDVTHLDWGCVIISDFIVDNGIAMSADHQFIFTCTKGDAISSEDVKFLEECWRSDLECSEPTSELSEYNKTIYDYLQDTKIFNALDERMRLDIVAYHIMARTAWQKTYYNPFYNAVEVKVTEAKVTCESGVVSKFADFGISHLDCSCLGGNKPSLVAYDDLDEPFVCYPSAISIEGGEVKIGKCVDKNGVEVEYVRMSADNCERLIKYLDAFKEELTNQLAWDKIRAIMEEVSCEYIVFADDGIQLSNGGEYVYSISLDEKKLRCYYRDGGAIAMSNLISEDVENIHLAISDVISHLKQIGFSRIYVVNDDEMTATTNLEDYLHIKYGMENPPFGSAKERIKISYPTDVTDKSSLTIYLVMY